MAIGTTPAGPGVPLTISVVDLAPLAAGNPPRYGPITYGEYVAWFTG
jgi:hypothetical protein